MKAVPTRHAVLLPLAAALPAAVIALLPCPAGADPMRPLHAAAAAAATPVANGGAPAPRDSAGDAPAARPADRLIAIRHDGNQRWQALVGERWLVVGDRLAGATVTAIDANSVQLAERGAARARRTLHLLPPLLPAAAPPRTNPSATP